jgi:putative cell wall-binding protein
MLKKLMVLLSLIALSASAVSATDVVLVSDNCADQTCALEVANVLNATIVTTTWGIYNESVIDEIKSLNPDKVIVIGGNLAVVDDYIIALENEGLTVERIGGQTRYDTNANITLRFQNEFAHAYGNATICVAHGMDDISLNETMARVRDGHCLVVLSNGTNLSVEPERLHLRINKVEVIENPVCPSCNHSAVVNGLRNKGLNVAVQNIPEDRVKSMIQNRIRHMEMKIEMLKGQGINTTELEEQLNEVNALMNQNKYQDAYRIMIQLEGEQMATVRLHLQPGGHGKMMGNNTNMGNMGAPMDHQNVGNTGTPANTNAPMNHQYENTTVGNAGAPHINHQNMKVME